MSRSNPNANNNPNPAVKWFEWKGAEGKLQWYDKEKEENVSVKLPFKCVVLDRTATVRGYSKKLKTGFYSNEVRDTRSEPFVVKKFSGGELATGIWTAIKDKVVANSGKFATNIYIAFMEGKELKIGCIQAVGCSLGPWFDFEREEKKKVYEGGISMSKGKLDKTGDVEFVPPIFELTEIKEETNKKAIALDAELQTYFSSYFKRPSVDQAAKSAEHAQDDAPPDNDQESKENEEEEPPVDEDVPF